MSASNPIGSPQIVNAFISMQLIGASGLFIVLITALLNKEIKRWATWYSFGASWIVSTLSYALLAFAGQQHKSQPAKVLCLIQTASIYAAPILTTCTNLSFLVHILLRLRFTRSDRMSEAGTSTKFVLVLAPYSAWVVVIIGSIMFSLENPATVELDPVGAYCHSREPFWPQMTSTIVLILCAIITVLQGYLGYLMYINSYMRLDHQILFATAIRVIIFGSIGFLTLIIALAYCAHSKNQEAFDIILAALPLLALITFGTQKDILDTWKGYGQRPTRFLYSKL